MISVERRKLMTSELSFCWRNEERGRRTEGKRNREEGQSANEQVEGGRTEG
jgi:hypothetical protein